MNQGSGRGVGVCVTQALLAAARNLTSTMVVRSHSRVPSDSGKSVGTVKVFTSMRLMGTACE